MTVLPPAAVTAATRAYTAALTHAPGCGAGCLADPAARDRVVRAVLTAAAPTLHAHTLRAAALHWDADAERHAERVRAAGALSGAAQSYARDRDRAAQTAARLRYLADRPPHEPTAVEPPTPPRPGRMDEAPTGRAPHHPTSAPPPGDAP